MEGMSLTGGTGDINPQWLSFTATESAADTTTTTTQTIPVQRLPQGGRAQVLEVLRVGFLPSAFVPIASATEVTDTMQCMISTKNFSTTATNFAEPTVFAAMSVAQNGAFTAAGTYGQNYDRIHWVDLTDGMGHGVLVATDNIFAQVQSSGTGISVSVLIKILYRWKNVSLQEYVGIVQSQQ